MRTIALCTMLLAVGCRGTRRIDAPVPYRPDSVIPVSKSRDFTPGAGAAGSAGIKQTIKPAADAVPTVSDDSVLEGINRILEDAFFDFDRYQLRTDAIDSLQKNAVMLKLILEKHSGLTLVVEGHCDELGSAEYNLALGERRAEVAREFLVQLGIPNERLRTETWGKERPVCTESTETCRQRNRRAHVRYSE